MLSTVSLIFFFIGVRHYGREQSSDKKTYLVGLIDDHVKHVFREHNQEADRFGKQYVAFWDGSKKKMAGVDVELRSKPLTEEAGSRSPKLQRC